MAQIIKHRRGALESVSTATKRAGELLVVTGSSGITAANGDSLLFVGIDGSTVTPANKILQGTSVPTLTGSDYDTSVDGIPFYDTDDEKLYILNKGGNVEVKAAAQTGGTGIISGSSQVSLVNTDSSSFDTDSVGEGSNLYFTNARVKTRLDAETVISGSSQVDAASVTNFDSEVDSRLNAKTVISGSSQVDATSVANFDSNVDARLDAKTVISGSGQVALSGVTGDTDDVSEGSTNLYFTDARARGAISVSGDLSYNSSTGVISFTNDAGDIESVVAGSGITGGGTSGDVTISLDSGSIAGTGLTAKTDGTGLNVTLADFSTTNLSEGTNLYFTNARVKTRLDAETVVSGSSQIVSLLSNQATDFGTGRVSGDNFGDSDGGSTFTGSFEGDGSGLTGLATNLNISGSTGNDTVDLINNALTFAGTANEIETAVTDNTVTIGLPNDVTIGNDLTVTGNLTVSGTQTIVDTNTLQIGDNIIELNGSGATNGGIHVKDATAPNTATGSLVWDSTNDYWKAGVKDSEVELVTISGTQTLTNKTINGSQLVNGSVANTKLENDGITIAGSDISLGGSITADAIANAVTGNVISGSSQVVLNDADKTGFDTDDVSEGSTNQYFTNARVKTRLDAEGVISGSSQVNANTITNFDSNVDARLDAKTVISGSSQVDATNVTNFDSNVDARLDAKTVISGSSQVDINSTNGTLTTLGTVTAGSVTAILPSGVISGSSQIEGNFLEVNGDNVFSGSSQVDLGSAGGTVDISSQTNFAVGDTAQVDLILTDDTLTANLKGGVISGSAQLLNVATDFGSGRVSGDNFGDADGGSTFTGSFEGDGSGLTGLATNLSISGSSGNDTVDLLNDALSFAGGTGVTAAVTDNTVTVNVQDGSTSVKGIASFVSDDFSVSSGNVSIKDGGVRAVNFNADVVGTGLSLDGVDNSLDVDYGSTAGTAVEGNTGLTIQGTTNEIEVSGGSVTLGSGGTVTVGLPDSVTITDQLTVNGNVTLGNQSSDTVTVTGNLSVLGTTTTVDSTTVQLGDNILELNYGGAQTDAGILVTDSQAPNTVSGSLLWDGTNDLWKGGALGSEKEFVRLDSSLTSGTVTKADANGLLVDSLITDDGTDVTISGTAELRINKASANSFVYFDSNKSLEAVTPSNAGDVIQWNGSSFVASREIDGGTF